MGTATVPWLNLPLSLLSVNLGRGDRVFRGQRALLQGLLQSVPSFLS